MSETTFQLSISFGVATLFVAAAFFGKMTGAPLDLGNAPPRIVELELASTEKKAHDFIETWKKACLENPAKPEESWRDRLLRSISWDTWFILAYAPLLAILCWLAAGEFASVSPGVMSAGRILAWGQLLAGVLDFVENAGMRRLIGDGTILGPWSVLPFYASVAKWALIAMFTIYVLAALVHRLAFR